MIKSNNTIPRDMLDILRACKGQKREDILFAKLGDKSSFEIIVLTVHDCDIELWNLEQPDKEGGVSDLAKIIVKQNYNKDCSFPYEEHDINGIVRQKNLDILHVNRKVVGITVYNELIQWTYEDNSFLLANTYAIVISLGKRFLHLTKSSEWSEIWDVSFHRTAVPKKPIWDESEKVSYSSIEL